jgi:hypothetical protein
MERAITEPWKGALKHPIKIKYIMILTSEREML